MTNKKRKTILAVALILIGASAFFLLRSYAFRKIGDSVHERLQSLKLSGFNVEYDSISFDWRTSTLVLKNLVLQKNAYDTTCVYPEFIAVNKITAQGFRLFPLLFKSKLSFERIYLDEPHLVIREISQLLVDSATQRVNEFTLEIDHAYLKSAQIEYTDTLNCQLITGYKGHLTLAGLNMDFHVNQPFTFSVDNFLIDSSEVKLPKEYYTLHVKRAKADVVKGVLELDSLQVIPDFKKIEFGRKHGYEIDRFAGMVPYIKFSGLSVSLNDSVIVKSAFADVQFYLKIFRDKRLPFKSVGKQLPLAQLRNLPFTLQIDSLKITKSYVQYEELVNNDSEAGLIYFDNLSGYFHNINNRSHEGNTTLVARADLMGQGDARIKATFPHSKNKKAWLVGSVQDFNIPKMNSMLTPSTNIKVESGNMNKLSFSFAFNEVRSDGEIELNYNDLKLITFKEEDKKRGTANPDELQKDGLKTFIMNTFIFRKHMDEKVPEEKRTGTVMYVRDASRSIFNFWVKSVLSGIKSAYNLDKPAAQKIKREERKEQKLSKREARKQKRAEKRRERG
jgi:hypothetical protein